MEDCTQSLDIPRKDGGRGLIVFEDCVELAVSGLEVYVHGSEEILLQAARGDRVDGLKTGSVLKKRKREKRLQDWEEKALHCQCLRQTKKVRSEQSWVWLQNGDLERETESLIVAARSIRTNLVKGNVDIIQKNTLCGPYKKADGSIDRVVVVISGCSKLYRESIKEGMIT